MKYMKKFGTLAEARAYKKHVLAEADVEPHSYMIITDEKVDMFSSSMTADPIIYDPSVNPSDEYTIKTGLFNGRLLGNDFDYVHESILSASDIAKVESLGTVFASKIVGKKLEPSDLQIVDFTTFENFTGVTSIDGMAGNTYQNLFGCVELQKINIPESVKEIGISAFAFCINLSDIKMHDSISAIKTKAFYNCTSLTNIEIPASVIMIENNAFNKCENLKKITFKSVNPCKLYKDSLTGIADDCIIYVPKSSVDAYKQQWKNVSNNIKGF